MYKTEREKSRAAESITGKEKIKILHVNVKNNVNDKNINIIDSNNVDIKDNYVNRTKYKSEYLLGINNSL